MKKLLLYTFISKGFDSLPHPNVNTNHVDHVVFTDDTNMLLPDGWRAVKVDTQGGAEAVAQRYKFFPPDEVWNNYERSIWINGNVHIKCDLHRMFNDLAQAYFTIVNQSPNYAGAGVLLRKHTPAVRETGKQIFELNSRDFAELCAKNDVTFKTHAYDVFKRWFGVTAHLPKQHIPAAKAVQFGATGARDSSTPVNFAKLARKFAVAIKGVIAVGAHYGQEFADFINAGAKSVVFVEPASAAFKVLSDKFSGNPQVTLVNAACGDKAGQAELNLSEGNSGQSSSLLQPALHLTEHPEIKFSKTELVTVITLDSLPLTPGQHNMLYIDAQGFELKILKGGKKMLQGIDLVYTEINTDEVYKGCAKVEQIDKFLSDFERVETVMQSKTWGDALYVRVRNMVAVPENFRPHINIDYPPGNKLIFEEWFFEQQAWKKLKEGRTYLPVFWTSYYVNNQYGKNPKAIAELQKYLDTLDRNKQYYTIVQYDDGILNDISGLDIKVFSMNAKEGEYPLPLIGQNSGNVIASAAKQSDLKDEIASGGKPLAMTEKKYIANFIGKATTHPLREKMLQVVKDKPGYYISTVNHGTGTYRNFIAQSTFTLCPRGYGLTSFRIAEALAYGSIPVYISDKFVFPHNIDFEKYGVIVRENELDKLPEILAAIKPAQIKEKLAAAAELFEKYFTYIGCETQIVNWVEGDSQFEVISVKKDVLKGTFETTFKVKGKAVKALKKEIASAEKPRNDGKAKPDPRKISLCITNYNRTDLLFKSLEYPLTDKRISEIVISDDCSTDAVFKAVQKFCKKHKKIKLFRNEENYGMSQNKLQAIGKAKNKWAILFDSDNELNKGYVDALFARQKWEPKTIYCPEFAEPKFDYTAFSGQQFDIVGVKMNLKKPMFEVLLNTCNYFVNRDEYVTTWQHDHSIKGSDTIFFNYLWLSRGRNFFVVPGMRYLHRVHDGSGFKADMDYNMKKAAETVKLIKEL